jgi:hypothetical protein
MRPTSQVIPNVGRTTLSPANLRVSRGAFKGRGHGDYASSHDLEDLLTFINGRAAIVEEIAAAEEIRSFIAQEFRDLLAVPQFVDALPGYLLPDGASQARLPVLKDRTKEISK